MLSLADESVQAVIGDAVGRAAQLCYRRHVCRITPPPEGVWLLFEDSSHMPHIEEKDSYLEALASFLAP